MGGTWETARRALHMCHAMPPVTVVHTKYKCHMTFLKGSVENFMGLRREFAFTAGPNIAGLTFLQMGKAGAFGHKITTRLCGVFIHPGTMMRLFQN